MKRKIKLLYIGRRIKDDRIYHAFLYGGKERYWPRARFVQIGRHYWGEKDGKDIFLYRTPDPCDAEFDVKDADKLDEWRLQNELANAFQMRKRASSVARMKSTRLREFPELRRICKSFSYMETKYFIEALVDQLRRIK